MPSPSDMASNLAKHNSVGSVCGSSSQADSGYGQSSQESVMTTEERDESNSSPDLLHNHSDDDDNDAPSRKSARVTSDESDNNDLESNLKREEEFRQSRAKSLEKGYASSSSSMASSSKLLNERFATISTSKPELLCNFCLSREKDAGIIHGGIIHQICCYPCAKRLYKKRQQCPMCRRKIEKISKIIVG